MNKGDKGDIELLPIYDNLQSLRVSIPAEIKIPDKIGKAVTAKNRKNIKMGKPMINIKTIEDVARTWEDLPRLIPLKGSKQKKQGDSSDDSDESEENEAKLISAMLRALDEDNIKLAEKIQRKIEKIILAKRVGIGAEQKRSFRRRRQRITNKRRSNKKRKNYKGKKI